MIGLISIALNLCHMFMITATGIVAKKGIVRKLIGEIKNEC